MNEDYFAEKVSVFLAFGPVVKLTHCKSTLLEFFAHHDIILVDTCKLLGIYEFFPANWLTTGAMRLLCGHIPKLCDLGIYLVADENPAFDNQERMQVYMGHFPSGASLNSLLHFSQIMVADRFQKFDHGRFENNRIYGSPQPPTYNI